MILDMKLVALVGASSLAIGLVVGGAGAWATRGWKADEAMAELVSTYNKSYAASSEQARAKESNLQKIADELRARVNDEDSKTNSAATALDATSGSLRDAASVYAASANRLATAEQRSKAAIKAAGVLSDLYGACIATKSEVAKFADESYKRGTRCEAQYDAVRSDSMKR